MRRSFCFLVHAGTALSSTALNVLLKDRVAAALHVVAGNGHASRLGLGLHGARACACLRLRAACVRAATACTSLQPTVRVPLRPLSSAPEHVTLLAAADAGAPLPTHRAGTSSCHSRSCTPSALAQPAAALKPQTMMAAAMWWLALRRSPAILIAVGPLNHRASTNALQLGVHGT